MPKKISKEDLIKWYIKQGQAVEGADTGTTLLTKAFSAGVATDTGPDKQYRLSAWNFHVVMNIIESNCSNDGYKALDGADKGSTNNWTSLFSWVLSVMGISRGTLAEAMVEIAQDRVWFDLEEGEPSKHTYEKTHGGHDLWGSEGDSSLTTSKAKADANTKAANSKHAIMKLWGWNDDFSKAFKEYAKGRDDLTFMPGNLSKMRKTIDESRDSIMMLLQGGNISLSKKDANAYESETGYLGATTNKYTKRGGKVEDLTSKKDALKRSTALAGFDEGQKIKMCIGILREVVGPGYAYRFDSMLKYKDASAYTIEDAIKKQHWYTRTENDGGGAKRLIQFMRRQSWMMKHADFGVEPTAVSKKDIYDALDRGFRVLAYKYGKDEYNRDPHVKEYAETWKKEAHPEANAFGENGKWRSYNPKFPKSSDGDYARQDWVKLVQHHVSTSALVVDACEILLEFLPEFQFQVLNSKSDKDPHTFDAALQARNKKQIEKLKKLAKMFKPYEGSSAQEIATKRDELKSGLHQCVLLSVMDELQELSIGLRAPNSIASSKTMRTAGIGAKWQIRFKNDWLYKSRPPWGGRIIPMAIEPYQNSINALTLTPANMFETGGGINQYLNCGEEIAKSLATFFAISKVVKNFKDSETGNLVNKGREIKLPLNFAFAELVDSDDGINIGKEIFLKNRIGKIKSGALYRDNIVLIKSVDVNFKGGNMATSKSDVEVKMSFLLPDIRFLNQTFKDTVRIGGNDYTYEYSFLDLITYTNNNTSTGFASIFKNQYHPDYNRLLIESMVYYKQPLNAENKPEIADGLDASLRNMPLVLDIAVVDHEIKKNNKTNQAEISINYRGYIDSAMTDPSIDALSSPQTIDARIAREVDLQKQLANGCTVDEIRNKIKAYSEISISESIDNLHRTFEELGKADRIFTARFGTQAVKASLDFSRTTIAKPWKIQDSFNKQNSVQNSIVGWHWMQYGRFIQIGKTKSKKDYNAIVEAGAKIKAKIMYSPKTIDFKTKFKSYYVLSGQDAGNKTKLGKDAVKIKADQKVADLITDQIQFFYFGDLIDVLLDSVHTDSVTDDNTTVSNRNFRAVTDRMVKFSGKDNYYFNPDPIKIVFCSFEWYMPTSSGVYKKKITNLADVPISIVWFAEWYRQEIIEKKLKYYPVASFVKKLAYTVITNLLGEVCFDIGSEHKILFRAQSDIGLFANERKNLENRRGRNKPQILSDYLSALNRNSKSRIKNGSYVIDYNKTKHTLELPLLKKSISGTSLNDFQRSDYCSYLTIYPANASSYEFQAKTSDLSAHDSGIPEFKYREKTTIFTAGGMVSNGANSLIESMDFTKQDAPYRREVKFFASNQGNLAQISGVYNVKIKLAKAAYFLYPGQLIWVDAGLQLPNNINSLAFTLGIGGYYQIISVNHKIEYYGGSSPNSSTMIEAAWCAYGTDQDDAYKKKAGIYKRDFIKKKTGGDACNSTVPKISPKSYRDVSQLAKEAAAKLKKKKEEEEKKKKTVPEGTPTGGKKEKKKKVGGLPKINTTPELTLGYYNVSSGAIETFSFKCKTTINSPADTEDRKALNGTIKDLAIHDHWSKGGDKLWYPIIKKKPLEKYIGSIMVDLPQGYTDLLPEGDNDSTATVYYDDSGPILVWNYDAVLFFDDAKVTLKEVKDD